MRRLRSFGVGVQRNQFDWQAVQKQIGLVLGAAKHLLLIMQNPGRLLGSE
jgi:hypothetical protein